MSNSLTNPDMLFIFNRNSLLSAYYQTITNFNTHTESIAITTFYLNFTFVNSIQFVKYYGHSKTYHGEGQNLYIEVPGRFSMHFIMIEKKKVQASVHDFLHAAKAQLKPENPA